VAIVRQVSNDNKPLDANEQRKEEEKVEKQIKKARERTAKRERNQDDPNALGIWRRLVSAMPATITSRPSTSSPTTLSRTLTSHRTPAGKAQPTS